MSYEQEFEKVLSEYPEEFQALLVKNKSRILWQLKVVNENIPIGAKLIDIGAGIIPFMLICQRVGYTTTIVDDFRDDGYINKALEEVIQLHKNEGVQVMNADITKIDTSIFRNEEYDLVFSSDSMEHWHHSPKKLFHDLWSGVKNGGLFWIGVPNCVNLRKRITVPLGKGKWSSMQDWYETEVFRGHVREPDVEDLVYIGRDLGAKKIEILGRNWIAYRHPSKLIRALIPVIDGMLRIVPGLCSDIYLFAWK